MEDFKKEFMKIQNNTILDIKKKYLVLLKKYRKQFLNVLVGMVSNYMKDIPIYKIEEWLEDYLMASIKSIGMIKICDMENNLRNILDKSIDEVSKNNRNVFNEYVDAVDAVLKKNSKTIWLYNISCDFQSYFIKELRHYYDTNSFVMVQNFEKSLENIRYDLRYVLIRHCDNFLAEYMAMLSRELAHNVSLMKNKFKNIKSNNSLDNGEDIVKQLDEELYKFYFIVETFGFSLYWKNNSIFVKDINSGEVIEMVYSNKLLRAKNEKGLMFKIDEDIIWYVDRSKDIILSYSNKELDVSKCDLKRKEIIVIKKENNGISYYYNNKKLEDMKEINDKVFVVMEMKIPTFYERLLSDSLVSSFFGNFNDKKKVR